MARPAPFPPPPAPRLTDTPRVPRARTHVPPPCGLRPSGLMRARYSLTPTSRSYLIDSPCCVRFERRMLSFAHALVGTVICSACGVLPKFWNTYLGHIGPASVMFIISELERFPGPNTVVTQGWTCVLGGLGYLTYDLIFSGCHLDMSCHGLREQQHIAINTLLICVGVDMIVNRSRFSASLIGLGSLFVCPPPSPTPWAGWFGRGVMLIILASRAAAADVAARPCRRLLPLLLAEQFMVLAGGTKGGAARGSGGRGRQDQRHGVRRLRPHLATLAGTVTEVVDYACAEGLPARLRGAIAGGTWVGPGGDARAGGVRTRAGFEMIRLTDDLNRDGTGKGRPGRD